MRFWLSGPRVLGGLVRPGISFGPEDIRARQVPTIHLERARKTVRQEAIARGMVVPPDAAIDAWLASEAARQRRPRPSIIAWDILKMIVAVPLAIIAIGGFWIAAMLLQQIH
jgi:hypothetical protein